MSGRIVRVSGPAVDVRGLEGARMYDLVRVGRIGLMGEIIRLRDELATVQVYEETAGLGLGEPVEGTGRPFMAELGPGPHRSGDIAAVLGRAVTSLGPVRNQLIGKGMIWSPHHGDTAFTVPLFDQFMHRIMPGDDWKA